MTADITDIQLSEYARAVAQRFADNGLKLTVAESCTGGWVAKLLTEVSGSSAWFERGFVTYSNEAKSEMLGVPAEIIEQHGAVSSEVVMAMTVGALQHSHADWALAISGIAGPDGGSEDKPVGTVWFAWQCNAAEPQSEMQIFSGDRDAVRRAACQYVLQGLLNRVT